MRTGRVFAGELLALRVTPSVRWTTSLAVVLAAGATAINLAVGHVHGTRAERSLLSYGGTPGLVMVILGVIVGAGAYRHRTIIPTLLVFPRRRLVVLAQAASAAVVGGLVGLVGYLATFAVALLWLAAAGTPFTVAPGVALGEIIGGVAYCALGASLGLGLGVLARNQVAAVSAVFVYLTIVDPSISALAPAYGRFGPTSLGLALSGGVAGSGNGPYTQLLTPVLAFTVLLLAAAVLVTAGVLSAARDVA